MTLPYSNIGHCYRGLNDASAARRYFAKAAGVYRRIGLAVLEARELQCVARMSIRMHGEAGIGDMDAAKAAFLKLGTAGEVCRSTVATMLELRFRNPLADLTSHCRQLEDEALALGVLRIADEAIYRLKEAARTGRVTNQVLSDTWDAFGATCRFPGISGAATVQN